MAPIGVYTIVVTVTDDDTGTGSAEVTVVVADTRRPTKVTGGGFVISSGRTSFGFVASRAPMATLAGQLQVRAPDHHRFHGTTVTSLVVFGEHRDLVRHRAMGRRRRLLVHRDDRRQPQRWRQEATADTISIVIRSCGRVHRALGFGPPAGRQRQGPLATRPTPAESARSAEASTRCPGRVPAVPVAMIDLFGTCSEGVAA